MKIVHVISGGESGGSKNHLLSLLSQFKYDEMVLVCMQEGELFQAAKDNGHNVRLLGQNSRYQLQAIKQIIEIVHTEKADLVHSHGARANLFTALAKRKLHCPLVTTIHSDPKLDFMTGGWKGKVFTRLNLWTYKKMDHLFAVTERFKDALIQLGVHSINITTIYNGIDFSEQIPSQTVKRSDFGLDSSHFLLAMVARLHPVKGHEYILEAIKKTENPNLHLLLIGDGPYRNDIEAMIENYGLENQVHLLGKRTDVDDLYRLSDIAVLASVSESFPLALLEAARAEKPVITTDVGGVRQLIKDDTYGWVVPIKDVDALRTAVEAAEHMNAQSPGQFEQMGSALEQFAKDEFSIENLADSYRTAYEKLIENK